MPVAPRAIGLMVAAVSAALFVQFAAAADHCQHCGCCAQVRKVCRVVPDTKEKTEVCWDVKCEDFCIPGPSKKCDVVHECDECGSWRRTVWQPGCAHICTKKVPVKTEVKRKVPTYKWEVVTLCGACCDRYGWTIQELSTVQKLAVHIEKLTTGQEPAYVPGPLVSAPMHTAALPSLAPRR